MAERESASTENTLHNRVRAFPKEPGVYRMQDSAGKILYVGKATNLRSRVASYFHAKEPKTTALMRKVSHIEWVLTATPYEALLLEINLIKQWRPPYNIDLRDGKSYATLRVTHEQYPRIFVTRNIVEDGSRYYGPYVRVGQAARLLELLTRLYPLRRCRGAVRVRSHPCLYYHIGQCSSPCAGKIAPKEYRARIAKIENILSGQTENAERTLEKAIEEQSRRHNFELASRVRDQLFALRALREDKPPMEVGGGSRDYIGYACDSRRLVFALFQSREGTLTGSYQYETELHGEITDQLVEFIVQFYDTRDTMPEAIITAHHEVGEELMQYYHEQRSCTVRIGTPQKPRDHTLLRLAQRNANAELYTRSGRDQPHDALTELTQALNLARRPLHIEGFDIAHVNGSHTVAAMVVFRDGKPHNSSYRRYRIRTLNGAIDDFESMREVVARRYTRLKNEHQELPDLIIIDGGIGQVNAAYGILQTLGIQHIALVGIAKRLEELYLPANSTPLRLPYDSAALHLVQQVRDEAHRFATAYRSQRHASTLDNNLLYSVPGIGVQRAAMLLKKYTSLNAIAAKDWRELVQETSLGPNVARTLVQSLRTHLKQNGSTPKR